MIRYLMRFEDGRPVPGKVYSVQIGKMYGFQSRHTGYHVGELQYSKTLQAYFLDCGRVHFFAWHNPLAGGWLAGAMSHCRPSLTLGQPNEG